MRESAQLSERCTTLATCNHNIHPFPVTCHVERSRGISGYQCSAAQEKYLEIPRLRSAPLGMTENAMAAVSAMSSSAPRLRHALLCHLRAYSGSSVRPSA